MWNPGRPSAVVPPLDGADRRVTLHGHPPPALVKSALTPSGLALPRLHSPVMRESRQYDRRRRVRGTRALQALLAALSIVLAPPVTGAEATPLATLPYSPGLDPDSMDRDIDPCEDLFQYSCGGWLRRNPIPPDRAAWDVYRKLADENLRYLWGLLESASEPDAERDDTRRLIGDYYAACMDTGRIEALGTAPPAPAFAAIDAIRSRDELAPVLASLHAAGGNGSLFFEFTSLPDFDDSGRVIGMFFAGGLGLPDRDYYLSTENRMRQARGRYREHVERMLRLAGSDPARAAAQAKAVLRVETALAAATLTRLEQRDIRNLSHAMSRTELVRSAPGFDWSGYLEARGVARHDRLNVTEPVFLAAVARLTHEERLEDLRAYLRWRYLDSHAEMLPAAFLDEHFGFSGRYLLGVETQPPRWRRCVEGVDADVGEALGKVFVQSTFSPDTRRLAVGMIRTIQSVMAARIRQLDWMSDATKEVALRKLAAIRNKIGHPDRWHDYGGLAIRRDDHFGNRIRSAAFEDARRLSQIGGSPDPDEWEVTPQTVNAWYEPLRNEMLFPAGVLQPPLFDPGIDAAPGWGNTGMTIGHELVHAFDETGRDLDAQGNLVDWWTPQDEEAFEQRAQCIVEQYSRYTVVDDVRLNAKLTRREDIADLTGTILAYLGWKAVTDGEPLESRDGLTPEQRFFVGAAQWACGHETEQRARARAVNAVHSPLRFRVNGVFVNMPEFAEAFQCQAGQAMVKRPDDVCRIW